MNLAMWLEDVTREGWFTHATQTQMQAVFILKANTNTSARNNMHTCEFKEVYPDGE